MHPTISMGDDCLAVKILPNDKSIFDGGLFIIRELKGICIRRLQFSVFKDTYQIFLFLIIKIIRGKPFLP